MKVEFQNYSLGVNNQAQKTARTVAYSQGATPSFKGGEKITAELMSEMKGQFMDLFPRRQKWWINFINKFKGLQGEKGGIVITAVGTGLVAPFPIAFNPMTKANPDATPEEKEELSKTKKYTALRQPVSAFCAITIQTPILKYIDKVLDNWTNNPDFAKHMWVTLDRSALNKDSYIETRLKKELSKGKTLDDLLRDAGLARLKGADGRTESNEDVIKRLVKHRAETQIGDVAGNLKTSGQIQIGSRFVANETLAGVINDQIDDYIKEISQLKKDEKTGIPFYLQRAKVLTDNADTLNEILDPNKISALPRDAKNPAKADPAALKGYLEELKKGDYNNDVKILLQEIIDKAPGVRESRCARTLQRIKTVKDACGGEFTLDKYYKAMKDRNSKLDSVIKSLKDIKFDIDDIEKKTVTIDKIKETIANLEKRCIVDSKDAKLSALLGDTDVFAESAEKLGDKVYKDVVKCYKKLVDCKYKGFNQITKIFVGVCITLPITCTALNWLYPRFMDIFFPGLAGTKKEADAKKNGGNE